MAKLKIARQEKFAQALADGHDLLTAYETAGYTTKHHGSALTNATSLSRQTDITDRVEEIRAERTRPNAGGDPQGVTDYLLDRMESQVKATGTIAKEDIICALIQNIRLAREIGQIATATTALKLIGQEQGMFVDKETDPRIQRTPTEQKISITKVNDLLDKLGFDGTIDAKTMVPIKISSRPRTITAKDQDVEDDDADVRG